MTVSPAGLIAAGNVILWASLGLGVNVLHGYFLFLKDSVTQVIETLGTQIRHVIALRQLVVIAPLRVLVTDVKYVGVGLGDKHSFSVYV